MRALNLSRTSKSVRMLFASRTAALREELFARGSQLSEIQLEIGFTIFAIRLARRSAPELGHLTFRFSADDLPRLLTISYSTC